MRSVLRRPLVWLPLIVFCLALYVLFLTERADASGTAEDRLHNDKAIVSLASHPSRFDNELPITLQSLLQQTVRPSEIRLFLPSGAATDPVWASKIANTSHLINVHYVDDVGPATKFRFVLQDLVVADDLDRPLIILGLLSLAAQVVFNN